MSSPSPPQDLLNHRHRLEIREDGSGEVQIAGLEELIATTADSMLGIIELGNKNRTTHATESNDVSSRSHAICQIVIRNNGKVVGKLSLIDLAGSERGADTKSHNRQRRMEGAEINKSLLALKECIRALDCNSSHIPYRASKLTLVLKDSFTNKNSRTVMVVNISPAASSADHTLNTLRYADRVKERGKQQQLAGGGMARKPAPVAAAAAPPLARRRSGSNPSEYAQEKGAAVAAAPEKVVPSSGRRGWDRGGGDEKIAAGKPPPRHQHRQSNYDEEDDEEDDFDEAESEDSRANNENLKQRKADIHQLHMSLRQEAAAAGGGGGGRRMDGRREEKNSVGVAAAAGGGAGGNEDRESYEDSAAEAVEDLHQTIEDLFEEEEELLNIHMNVIQENAELLTEEGRLLQQIQGDDVIDYDIEAYAHRLDEILKRKHELILILQRKLRLFKKHLKKEEHLSKGVHKVPSY
jgi:kinesin family member 2/24